MKSYKIAFEELKATGVTRWDTFPPKEGIVRWSTADGKEVARGKFKVIISVGPGQRYTLGYSINVYATAGIPFVEKVDDGPEIVDNVADESEIWERAEAIGQAVGADFCYQCGNILVAVFEFAYSN